MNLAAVIDGHPDDRVALISQSQEMTYGELRADVAALAGGLVDRGVLPDDRVAIVAANNRDFVVSLFAVLHVGAVAVPLNPRSPRPELAQQIEIVGARVVLLGPGAALRLTGTGTTSDDLVPGGLVIAPTTDAIPGAVARGDLRADPVDRLDREPDDLAVLMFTSGTAGGPKAAMLSHRTLLVNHDQLREHTDITGPDDVVYAVLPFSHIYGLNVVLCMGLAEGARLVLVENFDPANAVDSIQRHGVTVLPGVPPMFSSLVDLDEVPDGSLDSLRRVSSGASALAEATFEAFEERFGHRIVEGYGLTEAGPAVTVSTTESATPGSVGTVLPGVEVRLIDDEGHDAFVGDPGELWVRGPNVFSGYWREDEATRAALDDEGWLHTGDIGVVDDDGRLYIVDRRKDLVIVSGFNVFPAEVEAVIEQIPGVAEVVVAGVPHPHTGEAVMAHVVLDDGASADEDVIITYCEQRLPRYKAPSKVRFVTELPRDDAGKVSRRRLRD